MMYLLIFYWIFAALFCFGAVYKVAQDENKSIIGTFIGCLVTGGILFPMYLGVAFEMVLWLLDKRRYETRR